MMQNKPIPIIATEVNEAGTRQNNAYPDLKETFIIFLVFILNSILIAIPAVIAEISLNAILVKSPSLKSFLFLLEYIATLLLTLNYVIKKSKKKQGYFQKVSFSKAQWQLIPVIIISTVALTIPLQQASSWIPMSKFDQKFFDEAFTKDVFSIVTGVIAAPLLEEMLCRGIILRGLLQNYPPYWAIAISAIFFGAIHLNPWQAIPAFFSALFLGWIYYKTKSLIPCIIIHLTNNLVATSFLFMPRYRQGLVSAIGMPDYLVACIAAVAIFAASCYLIHRKLSIIPGQ